MISSIIFSKDRALQLDLLLNSIYRNFPETVNDTRVIWTASSDRFELAYNQLQQDHPKIIFKKQTPDFFYDLYQNVCVAHNKYICLFTDDDIVYKKVKFDSDVTSLLDDNSFVCYSLRLGHNIVHRDIYNEKHEVITVNDVLPTIYEYNNMTIWNRIAIPYGGYWNYAFSVDGHIFRKPDLMRITELLVHWSKIEKLAQNPNQLEATLQRFDHDYGAMMLCNEYSSIVNSPNNRVQNLFENRHGDHYSFSQEHCNNLYLIGNRIKFDKIEFGEISKAHQELDILAAIE